MKKNIGLLLVCFAGLFLRLYGLGKVNLWFDEISTGARVGTSLAHMFKGIDWMPFPPLYYLILNFWVKIFGMSVVSLRLPSAIFSSLSIFFIFKLAKELYDEKVAFFSALLLCVSPFSINYAQEAKMYSMLWFWGILSFYYLYKFIKNNTLGNLSAYVAVTTFSIYTMYVGFVFIVIHNILFLSVYKREKIRLWVKAQVLIFLLYLPWIRWLFFHFANRHWYLSWINKTNDYLGSLIFSFKLFTGVSIGQGSWINRIELCIYALLAVSAVIIFRNIRFGRNIFDFKREESLLFLWILIPNFIFYLIDVFMWPIFAVKRYIGFIHMPMIILFSKGINTYNCKIAKIKLKFIILLILLLSIFLNHLSPYYKYGLKMQRDDFVECFKWLNENADKNSLIINVNMPHLVIQYFGLGHRSKRLMGLSQARVKNYESVFLLYYSFKKDEKDKLMQTITKNLQLSVFKEFCFPGTINRQTGASWLKKQDSSTK